MQIAIIGQGSWGKAIGSVLDSNNKPYKFYGREENVKANIIILAVPTESMESALKYIDYSDETIIINTAKGIQQIGQKLPSELVKNAFGEEVHYFSLLGPGFANQVINKELTIVNVGYKNKEKLGVVKEIFGTSYFKLIETPHINSLEIIAAFKNIYAIACGLISQLGYKENTQAAFILLGAQEIYRILDSMKLTYDNSILPEIYGDMMLTCTSSESRNYRFGSLLCSKKAEAVLKELGTVEGYHTLEYVEKLREKNLIALPLAAFVRNIISINEPEEVKGIVEDFIKGI